MSTLAQNRANKRYRERVKIRIYNGALEDVAEEIKKRYGYMPTKVTNLIRKLKKKEKQK
jgi:hypothetical protein